MTLISGCLLLFSTHLLADRPAMSERGTPPETEASTALGSEVTAPDASPDENLDSQSDTAPEALSLEVEIPATSTESTQDDMDSRPAMSDAKSPTAEATDKKTVTPETADRKGMKTGTRVTGDVLELHPGDTLPIHAPDFPKRGTTMANVKEKLGEPLETSPPVGDPPITSWRYSDRTVYFEYKRVIHAVYNN